MRRRLSRLGAALAVLGVLAWLQPIGPAQSAVASPTVEAAPAGLHGFPFSLGCCYYNFGDVGYDLEEYLISGTAKSYASTATAPFKTRMIVAKPNASAKVPFNGTVLAEWENVTAQAPAEPGMVWMHNYLLQNGYGYAAINAQKVGTDFLTKWDPVRYEGLAVTNDEFSFDVFSQAVAALKHPTDLAPFGDDMTVERVIGYGQSQSAGRLNTYMGGAATPALSAVPQNDADEMDGVIIQADGGTRKSFPNLQIPLVHLETEDGIHVTEPGVRDANNVIVQPNNPAFYRLWEVVGTAHVGNEETQSFGTPTLPVTWTAGVPIPWGMDAQYWENSHYGEEGPGIGATCEGGVEMPLRYALNAALEGMHQRLQGGPPIVQPPRADFDEVTGAIVKDEFGNAMGGLRLPPIRVPVATYNASTCGLFGTTVPLTPTQLLELYPTHAEYVSEMLQAVNDAIAEGVVLPVDGAQMMRKVDRSFIPLWRPSTGFGL
jgi:hypothetical protein